MRDKSIKLYISVTWLHGSLLAKDNESSLEQGRLLSGHMDLELRYRPIEKMCLALQFTRGKLWHYLFE